jgi:drug/metabolite transporter (DMT)-like permease
LKETAIDPASFTTVRLASGALALWLMVQFRNRKQRASGDWRSALALFAYAAPFSFAYVSVQLGAGTLLLFGTVQATMILAGFWLGERLTIEQTAGLGLALAGFVILLMPGLTAPPLGGSALMIIAGIAWGVYSLMGRSQLDALGATAANFLRAAPLALALSLATLPWAGLDIAGVIYAILSGTFASGVGYAIWYAALCGLTATRAAVVQLSVPVIAALGGVVFVNEPITLRLLIASAAILGGIALVVVKR